jgi:class 3 adenylate cyclase
LRIVLFKTAIFLFRLTGVALVVLILIFLLPLVVPYMKNAQSFEYIKGALKVEKAISYFVQGIVPTVVSGKDITRWIVIVAAVVIGVVLSNIKERIRDRSAHLKLMKEYEEWKTDKHLSDDSKLVAPLKEKIEQLETTDKKDREELLKLFAETKKKLDAMGRDLAFLAIDIVDSTGLKQGEEKGVIEYDFREYKHFVEDKFVVHGVLKTAWTPDGVMACFPTVDAAVSGAKDVLDGLEHFNTTIKTMKRDFVVRCGINAGYVYFDETMPLEEMSDRVIDIAGHMQKHADPNTICIAKPAIEPLEDRSGFIATTNVVDGYEVYMADRRKAPREESA